MQGPAPAFLLICCVPCRLLLLHERAESRRGEWSDAGRQRVEAALTNGVLPPAHVTDVLLQVVGTWISALCPHRRAEMHVSTAGNAVPYAGVSSPGAAPHFGGAAQNTTAGAAAAAAAAELTAALAACQQQAAAAAVSAWSREGRFPACLVSDDRQIGRVASEKQPPRSFLFNELSTKEIQSVEDALVCSVFQIDVTHLFPRFYASALYCEMRVLRCS